MEVNLSQDLSKELCACGLFNMFNSNSEERIKVLFKQSAKSIDNILFKYHFRKETGIIPITEPFRDVFKGKSELVVDFYINEEMNARPATLDRTVS